MRLGAREWIYEVVSRRLSRAGVRQPCYSGPPETRRKGTCRDGVRAWGQDSLRGGSCPGELVPRGESCYGEDDDCDGA